MNQSQSHKRRLTQRALMHPQEREIRMPWFHAFHHVQRKERIAQKLAFRHEKTLLRKLEREDLAKGITPDMAKLRTESRQKDMHPEHRSMLERMTAFIKKPRTENLWPSQA